MEEIIVNVRKPYFFLTRRNVLIIYVMEKKFKQLVILGCLDGSELLVVLLCSFHLIFALRLVSPL